MKTAFILLSLTLMVACSPADDTRPNPHRIEKSLSEVCLNGVVYYYHGHGVDYHGWGFAPKFKPDSTVETCE
jgi:major membrane immunogen (membrane-anchored lipoprotein)